MLPIESSYTQKEAVRRAFSKAAPTYDACAVLQREVSDRMQSRLAYIRHTPNTILDVGSGTGYGARALKNQYPNAHLIELDLAEPMLRYSQKENQTQAGWRAHLPFLSKKSPFCGVCGDSEQLPIQTASMDLIWSNLTIQWCNEPDTAFAEFRRVLKKGGLLLFSTLGPDTLHELRSAFSGIDGHTHVNQFIDMHDLGDALLKQGFSLPVMDMEKIILTYQDVKSVMRDLQGIGARNATQGRKQGLMGKNTFKQVEENYARLRQAGRLPATYEVIYGHAWVDAPSKTAEGHAIVQFNPKRRSR